MINFTRPAANSQRYQSLNVITELEECRRANHQRGKRITVLGAGIAGLVAAYELERLGHQVDIMEGSPRIGGRIWTHRFGDGPGAPYGELGAMRIPGDHDYVLHYVHAMGLGDKLCKFVTMFEEPNALFHYQGGVFPIQDGVEGILHQTTYPRGYSRNTRLFAAWLQLIVNAIASEELRQCLTQDLNSHLMDELEMVDLEPFIGAGGKGIDLDGFIKEHPDFRKQCSKALDLFLGDILIETSHDLLQLEGGMDQLTNRLATAVKGPIKCNQEVVAIRVLENGIEVSWLEKGRLRKRYCDYVLCTIPFSVLRKMELKGFHLEKLEELQYAVYWPATKVLLHCAQPFWQQNGIFGGASFSDEGIRQIYYPSVKGNPSQGSVLLASYTIGNDAEHLARMSEQDRKVYVKNAVSQLHPEIQTPGMVLDTTTITWSRYKWSFGACSVPWNRDLSYEYRHPQDLARPHKTLFFAGEHCSGRPAWIQGAMESALQAVHGIVSHKAVTGSSRADSISLDKVYGSICNPAYG